MFLLFPLDDEVNKKIKSIRTIYTRERGKIKHKSGDGVDEVYVPTNGLTLRDATSLLTSWQQSGAFPIFRG